MSEQRRKDPVRGVSVMIVVIVLLVIGTVLYNAISEKRAYDAQQGGAASTAAPAASSGAAPASGG